jgi:hypothetical protein
MARDGLPVGAPDVVGIGRRRLPRLATDRGRDARACAPRIPPGWSPPPTHRRATPRCPRQNPDHVGDQVRGGTQALVVPGLPRQVREQVPQMRMRVPQPAPLGGVALKACITASVISSASLSCTCAPTAGRGGAISGKAFSRSSAVTCSAVAGVYVSGHKLSSDTLALWATDETALACEANSFHRPLSRVHGDRFPPWFGGCSRKTGG